MECPSHYTSYSALRRQNAFAARKALYKRREIMKSSHLKTFANQKLATIEESKFDHNNSRSNYLKYIDAEPIIFTANGKSLNEVSCNEKENLQNVTNIGQNSNSNLSKSYLKYIANIRSVYNQENLNTQKNL